MAKLYRKKRVSKGYNVRMSGDVNRYSNYEAGHVLYQTDHALPMDAPLHMKQGYSKSAKEADLVWMADFRRLYRIGRVSPLPNYRYMVQGITPFLLSSKAQYPLARGQKGRLPQREREKQKQIDKRYVKLAFG